MVALGNKGERSPEVLAWVRKTIRKDLGPTARKASAVIMLKLDRMFRNATDCLATVEAWDKAGVGLHVVDLGGNAIDTTSAAGRFMLVVLAGAAEMERNLVRERTKSALAVKRANGQRVGAVPYGSDLADDGATLVENTTEQAVIREMKAMRARGMKLKQIAADLTARGVPTKTGKDRWSHQAVARILKRERGMSVFTGTCCTVQKKSGYIWPK